MFTIQGINKGTMSLKMMLERYVTLKNLCFSVNAGNRSDRFINFFYWQQREVKRFCDVSGVELYREDHLIPMGSHIHV